MLEALLLILTVLVLYHHLGFALIMKAIKPKAVVAPPVPKEVPHIALIVPVFNEEKTIKDKILNTAALSYPKGKLKLIIACDGCTDQTYREALHAQNLPEAAHLNISVMDFASNRGKVAVLNEVIAKTDFPLIALSDCSSLLSLDALERVAAHFENPKIAVVGGTYHFMDQENDSEEAYWAYQRSVKKGEAHFGSPMGFHGAFYAFRQKLCAPLSAGTINDDFILPMKIIAQGYRAVYDGNIRCLETERTTHQMNWKRRIRIAAGNMQQVFACISLLSPRQPGIAFCFFSGKFLRAFMPLMLICLFGLSAVLSFEYPLVFGFFMLQLLGLAVLALPVGTNGRWAKGIQILRYIFMGHLAGLIGSVRYLLGLEKGAWKRAV